MPVGEGVLRHIEEYQVEQVTKIITSIYGQNDTTNEM